MKHCDKSQTSQGEVFDNYCYVNFDMVISALKILLLHFAIYLKNQSPTKEKNVISWEAWYNKCPNNKHYKIFECPAYIQIPKKKWGKLIDKKWK